MNSNKHEEDNKEEDKSHTLLDAFLDGGVKSWICLAFHMALFCREDSFSSVKGFMAMLLFGLAMTFLLINIYSYLVKGKMFIVAYRDAHTEMISGEKKILEKVFFAMTVLGYMAALITSFPDIA